MTFNVQLYLNSLYYNLKRTVFRDVGRRKYLIINCFRSNRPGLHFQNETVHFISDCTNEKFFHTCFSPCTLLLLLFFDSVVTKEEKKNLTTNMDDIFLVCIHI